MISNELKTGKEAVRLGSGAVDRMLDSYLMNLREEIDRLLSENGMSESDIAQVLVADDGDGGFVRMDPAEFLEEAGRPAGVNAVVENRSDTSKPLEGETVYMKEKDRWAVRSRRVQDMRYPWRS